ncbi:MAG: hypothetical protein JXA67_20380 [Micromonosporaceae bacterium]|nr:hypothetical protein [Micromonosporaceae bacterium]
MSNMVFRVTYSTKWTGSNATEIRDMCQAADIYGSAWSVDEETPEQTTLRENRLTGPDVVWVVYAAEPWVVVTPGFQGIFARLSDSVYGARFLTAESVGILIASMGQVGDTLLADEKFVTAIVAQVPTPPAQTLYTAVGRAALPILAPNGTTTAVVDLDAAMPNASYIVKWRAVAGAAVLSTIVLNGTITKTTTQVTIPLKSTGVSVAGVLLVEVFWLG